MKQSTKVTITCLAGFLLLFLAACPAAGQKQAGIPVHFYDQPDLSIPLIKKIASTRGSLSLMLLDFQIDHRVDVLAADHLIKQIYWIPGHKSLIPAKLSLPGTFREPATILNQQELGKLLASGIPSPFVVSLNLDTLTDMPSGQGDHLLLKLLDTLFTEKADAIVITFTAGQNNVLKTWHLMTTAYALAATKGLPSIAPGSLELWNRAPAALWALFRKYPPAAGNKNSAAMLKKNMTAAENQAALERNFPAELLDTYLDTATLAVDEIWQGGAVPEKQPVYYAENNQEGIAIRFVSGSKERGCLAYYSGVKNFREAAASAAVCAAFFDPRYPVLSPVESNRLEVEVTVFSAFVPMKNPLDFIPGIDALLLETSTDRTLLQPSIAVERNLSAVQFLEAITHKAGLMPGSWQTAAVRFYKAPAVSLRRPYRV